MAATAKQVITRSAEEEFLQIENERYYYMKEVQNYVISLFNPILDEFNTND